MTTLKTVIILFFSFFLVNSSIAQKVKVKKGQVTVNGTSYCQTNCGGALTTDCKIKNLDGEILVSLVYHDFDITDKSQPVYELIFLNTEYKAQMKIVFGMTKKIIREFYEYEVIKDGKLNEAGVQNFVKAYSYDWVAQFSNKKNTASNGNASSNNDNLVERDRTADIQVFGKKIMQDFKLIGNFEGEDKAEGGKIIQYFSISLPDGSLVARATMEQFSDSGICKIITQKDNKTHSIAIKSQIDSDKAEAIAKYLVEKLYL